MIKQSLFWNANQRHEKSIEITFVMFSKDILIYVKSILGCRHLDDVHGKVLNN